MSRVTRCTAAASVIAATVLGSLLFSSPAQAAAQQGPAASVQISQTPSGEDDFVWPQPKTEPGTDGAQSARGADRTASEDGKDDFVWPQPQGEPGVPDDFVWPILGELPDLPGLPGIPDDFTWPTPPKR
ncbi:hypothetical protein ACFWU3_04905 [Streptomyces sp. NPDC058685]|uniref:hypothetical protein n=1 Tax=Streptomyces sp. NPDC058685 TaxID=3346598 RepID=UPI003657C010